MWETNRHNIVKAQTGQYLTVIPGTFGTQEDKIFYLTYLKVEVKKRCQVVPTIR